MMTAVTAQAPSSGPVSSPTRRLRRPDPYALAGLLLLTLVVLPARMSAFRGDDAFTSEWDGQRVFSGDSRWSQLLVSFESSINTGRPSLLGGIQGYLSSWFLGNHRMALKLLIIAYIVLAGYLLYRLVLELGGQRSVGLLVLAALAGAIQFRSFHDGSLGYWGVSPLVMVFTFASLLAFLRWLRGGRTWVLALSIVLFVGCLLLYEVPYPFCLLHVAVALFERRGRAALVAAAPFVVVSFAFVAYSYFGRQASTTIDPNYDVGGTIWGAVRVFMMQLFSPIPGSSLFFAGEYANFLPLGSSPTRAEIAGGLWRGLAVGGVCLLVCAAVLRGRAPAPAPGALGRMALLGGLIWVLPVTLISLAPKYQAEIVPGKGHLPALMQVYGWALVATAIVLMVLAAARRRSRQAAWLTALAVSGLIGVGAAVDGYINLRVVALEQPIVETRELVEQSVAGGVLAGMPQGSTLLFLERDLKWATGNLAQDGIGLEAMLANRTGRRYDGRLFGQIPAACPAVPTIPPPDCAPPHPRSAWVHVRARPDGGAVIVARMDRVQLGTVQTAGAPSLRVFTRQAEPPLLGGFSTRGRPWASTGLRWREADRGDGWKMFEARTSSRSRPIAASLYDDRNPLDFMNFGTPAEIVRRFGTKRLLP
jgi:hypothetical protein